MLEKNTETKDENPRAAAGLSHEGEHREHC